MADWINFQGLRERLDFAAVLRHYNVETKPGKGKGRLQGFCPLPTHRGERRSPSFSVDLDRKLFKCFGGSCQAGGNILDFCVRMEGKDPADNRQVLEVAKLMRDRFGLNPAPNARPGTTANAPAQKHNRPPPPPQGGKDARPEARQLINPPLDFELKELDGDHPYLRERGFLPETIRHFGLGFCGRGMLAGRIAIPLHDPAGRLIGYAGRLVKDADVRVDNPKYKFPSERERAGVLISFKKSLFLYNGFRIKASVNDLIVVEGFPSVWWLWQHGYNNVVSVMGSSCSPEQAGLIVSLTSDGGRVWTFTDGDDGGERCAGSVLVRVGPKRSLRHVPLERGEQPTDCSADELAALLVCSRPGGIVASPGQPMSARLADE